MASTYPLLKCPKCGAKILQYPGAKFTNCQTCGFRTYFEAQSMPITQTSSMTSYRIETANPPQKDWAFGGSIKCPYCLNRVKPQSRFNWGIFLLLFISTWVLLEVPAIAYWGLRHGRYKCPNCNLSPLFDKQRHIVSMPENWGPQTLSNLSVADLNNLERQLKTVHADPRGISRVNSELKERAKSVHTMKAGEPSLLTTAQKGNLIWAVFWLIIWVAFLGPIGLIGWLVGWFVWGMAWIAVKDEQRKDAEEARISAQLVICPFCHQEVHPQAAESKVGTSGRGILIGRGGISGIFLGGGSSSQEFWRCSNCGMDLGRR